MAVQAQAEEYSGNRSVLFRDTATQDAAGCFQVCKYIDNPRRLSGLPQLFVERAMSLVPDFNDAELLD